MKREEERSCAVDGELATSVVPTARLKQEEKDFHRLKKGLFNVHPRGAAVKKERIWDK